MKKLQLTFLNGNGSKHRWTPKFARDDLNEEQVKALMNGIVDLGIYEKGGVPHCTGVASAKYIETIETIIFDLLENQKRK